MDCNLLYIVNISLTASFSTFCKEFVSLQSCICQIKLLATIRCQKSSEFMLLINLPHSYCLEKKTIDNSQCYTKYFPLIMSCGKKSTSAFFFFFGKAVSYSGLYGEKMVYSVQSHYVILHMLLILKTLKYSVQRPKKPLSQCGEKPSFLQLPQ